ncbi:MAG TPA: hypothetical protein VLA19_30645 [Herpetosiphonaceae bacterium]|nr:hypothetical protein [Herpetosiphonaceae bacterium]
MDDVRRRPDGTIDCDFYVQQSRARHAKHMDRDQSAAKILTRSPRAKRYLRSFVAAGALATGMFWATMLSSPPVTQADSGSSDISIFELHKNAAGSLTILVTDAI